MVSLFGMQCINSEDKDLQPPPTLQILSPAKGSPIKVSDTVVIITKTDYTRFSGGIHITYSFDSAKTWTQVRSLGPKASVFVDTVRWHPGDEAADPVVAGAKAMLRVTDYNKAIATVSDFVFIQ